MNVYKGIPPSHPFDNKGKWLVKSLTKGLIRPLNGTCRQPETLRFGWQNFIHVAITQNVLESLNNLGVPATTPFTTVDFKKHRLDVVTGDLLQDALYYGPAHYQNFDDAPEQSRDKNQTYADEFKYFPEDDASKTFDQVKKELKQIDKNAWAQKEDAFFAVDCTVPSSLNQIVKLYDLILRQLHQIKSNNVMFEKINQVLKQDVYQSLEKTLQQHLYQNLGALSHYLADLQVPFHNTVNGIYDWQLPWGDKGIHGFFEGHVVPQEQDAKNLLESAPVKEVEYTPWLKESTLTQYLRKQYRENSLKVWDIADAVEDVNQLPGDARVKTEALKTRLNFMVYQQILTARNTVVDVYRALFREAAQQ